MPARPAPRAKTKGSALYVALPLGFFLVGLVIAACTGTLPLPIPHFVPSAPGPSPLNGVLQLVVVVTPDWDATGGWMHAYERVSESATWTHAERPVTVAVGRSGLGWGRGLHLPQRHGPQAREGDGRAPAGAFELGPAFGFASKDDLGIELHFPYLQEHDTTECIDDVRSRFYNTIVDRSAIQEPDWNSSEKMTEQGEDYRWGIVVKQNDPPIPGGGSCIFLHSWARSAGTAGCTGLDNDQMERLLHWLDKDKHPVIVQLPRDEYDRLRNPWRLPPLD